MLIAVAWIVLSLLVGLFGRDRAFGFWGWFLFAFLFSPLLAVVMLLLAGPSYRRL